MATFLAEWTWRASGRTSLSAPSARQGVAVLAGAYFVTGNAGPLVMLLAAGDAVFALIFIRLLRAHAAG
ncbi:MAG: hypothetical protein IPF84_00465 [Proteobacteria bacterium]|nr:hypothetical protein [Pseudomonadota bacterium]